MSVGGHCEFPTTEIKIHNGIIRNLNAFTALAAAQNKHVFCRRKSDNVVANSVAEVQ